MKKKLLRIFFAFIMFFSVLPTQHIYNTEETKINAVNHSGGYIYFDNSVSKWNDNYIMLFVGHSSWCMVTQMKRVSNTNLFYCNMASFNGATGFRVVGDESLWDTGGFNYSSTSNLTHYTATNTNYTLNSGSTYTIKASSSSNNCSISVTYRETGYEYFNSLDLTANLLLSTDSGSTYSSSSLGGSVEITASYISSHGTSTTPSPASSSSSTSVTWLDAAYTGSATFVASANSNYNFDGWYTSSSGGTAVSTSTSYSLTNVTSSQTLYARFSEKSYTVTYDPGSNGTGDVKTSTVHPVTSSSLLGQTYTREGYTQTGWSTSDGGSKTYSLSQSIISTNALKLYPYWTAQNYTVNYDPNGGNGTTASSNHTYGVSSALTANGFSLPGYSFAGWNTADDGSGTPYSNQQSVSTLTPTDGGIVTLYAQWSANTYTVTLDNQGADISSGTTSVQVTYNGELPTITIPEKTGYKFKGYYSVKNSTSNTYKYYNQDGGPYSAHKIYTLTEDTTYYATWEAKEFTINFNINYEGGVNPDSTTVTYDSYYNLPIPEREGYVFK